MLTYKLSRREKVLVFVLAIILVATAWFVFVFQRTNDEIMRLDSEISAAQTQISAYQAREAQMREMEAVIEQRKAEGAKPVEMPKFDNIQALMAQLNVILSTAVTYNMSFDALDPASGDHVERGVSIDYSTDSYAAAEAIVAALANGKFPCRIDSVSINDSSVRSGRGSTGKAPVSATVHVTFFEQVQG